MPVPEHLSSRERFLSAKNLGITGKLKITGNRGGLQTLSPPQVLIPFFSAVPYGQAHRVADRSALPPSQTGIPQRSGGRESALMPQEYSPFPHGKA